MKLRKTTSLVLAIVMALSSLNMCFAEEVQTTDEIQTKAVTEEEPATESETEDTYIEESTALSEIEAEISTEAIAEDKAETLIEDDTEETTSVENMEDVISQKEEDPIIAPYEEATDDVNLKTASNDVAYAVEGGYIYFNKSTGEIMEADKSITRADIPSRISGVSVISIASGAFKDCNNLVSINIPDSVIGFGNEAFYGCSSLKSIKIPKNNKAIGYGTFRGCTSLESIEIPSAEYIGQNAFNCCFNLAYVKLPNNLTKIGEYAFESCTNLTNITIPNSVTLIDSGAFLGCDELNDIVLPNSLLTIGEYAFSSCDKLNNIILPNSLTEIGDSAFYCTSLTSVTIPKNVKQIGARCFGGDVFPAPPSLKEIKVSDENIYYDVIDGILFRNNGTELVLCPPAMDIRDYVIPNKVINIKDSAFGEQRYLKSLIIPDSVTSIGDYTFSGCPSLTNITIPNSVTSIGVYEFAGCTSLTSITIPDSVTSIGEDTFSSCISLTSITIPDSVTAIGSYAFWGCSSLTSITIPGNVTFIGEEAFYGCDKDKLTFYVKQNSFADTWAKQNGFKVSYSGAPSDNPTPSVNVAPPSFAVKGVFGGRDVTFNCNTPGATIYYTTANRSALNLNDPHVKPGETVHFDAYYGTIYARAYYNGKWGNVARLILKIPKVNDPTITKLSNGKVKIKTTTPSCIVYYTTDGTTPSANNYAGKFWTSHDVKIPAGRTVKAIAVRSCFSDSKVTTGKA